MKKIFKKALGRLLCRMIYIPIMYKEDEPRTYQLALLLSHVLIKCYCTRYERNLLEIVSNLEVIEGHRAIHKEQQSIAVLTVNFKVFQYVCVNEKFPEPDNVKLKIRV